jgi:hypothetical protein
VSGELVFTHLTDVLRAALMDAEEAEPVGLRPGSLVSVPGADGIVISVAWPRGGAGPHEARLNDEALHLLDQALREALSVHQNWIGVEHIRMALARPDLQDRARVVRGQPDEENAT